MYEIGVSKKVQFCDVYSLDEEDLKAMLPSPIHAFILLYPIDDGKFDREDRLLGEVEEEEEEDKSKETSSKKPFYLSQTIDNACGFIALLHVIAALQDNDNNDNDSADVVAKDSILDKYLEAARKCPTPRDRGVLLESNEALASVHRTFAQQGSTEAPQTLEEEMAVNLHFVALVPSSTSSSTGPALWELDGRKRGPVKRGEGGIANFVAESLKLIKWYMERAGEAHAGSYSVLALVPNNY